MKRDEGCLYRWVSGIRLIWGPRGVVIRLVMVVVAMAVVALLKGAGL